MKTQANGFAIRLIMGMLKFAWVGAAAAQQIPDAGQILRETRPPPAPVKPPPTIDLGVPVRPAVRPDAGLGVQVKEFRFTGVTLFKPAQLQALLSDRIGKTLGFAELETAANTITVFYRQQGYFGATAYLPAQEIKDGVVEITVVEGRLGKIKLKRMPDVRLKESIARGYLDHIPLDRPLSEREVERALLLLNDLPGISVSGMLEPGETAGTGDLSIQMSEGKRVSGSVEFDNSGSRSTGEHRAGVGVSLNDPSGRGDQLNLRGLQAQAGGMDNVAAAYIIPINSMGTKAEINYSALDYRLGKDFAALNASGKAQVVGAKVSHSIVRSRSLNVIGQVGVESKKFEDRIDSTSSINDKTSRNLSLRLATDRVDDWLGGGSNFLSVTYTRGRLALDTPSVSSQDAAPDGRQTQGVFQKWNYSLSRQQVIASQWSVYGALSGQSALMNLDSSEKFSLGGPYGVRAYPVAQASADEGLVANLELRYLLPQTTLPGDWMLMGFVDGGRAKINKDPLPTDSNNVQRIYANGVGLNWSGYRGVNLRTSLAWSAAQSSPADVNDRNPRLYLQMSMGF